MSSYAREVVRMANWADAQFGELLSPWEEQRLHSVWQKLRERAGFLIGFMA